MSDNQCPRFGLKADNLGQYVLVQKLSFWQIRGGVYFDEQEIKRPTYMVGVILKDYSS